MSDKTSLDDLVCLRVLNALPDNRTGDLVAVLVCDVDVTPIHVAARTALVDAARDAVAAGYAFRFYGGAYRSVQDTINRLWMAFNGSEVVRDVHEPREGSDVWAFLVSPASPSLCAYLNGDHGGFCDGLDEGEAAS